MTKVKFELEIDESEVETEDENEKRLSEEEIKENLKNKLWDTLDEIVQNWEISDIEEHIKYTK